MRLSPKQIATIVALTCEVMGEDASVFLFGSRLDDTRRGGDLDLLVETQERPTLLQRAELKRRLEEALDMPADVIARARGAVPTAFQKLAIGQGVQLVEGFR